MSASKTPCETIAPAIYLGGSVKKNLILVCFALFVLSSSALAAGRYQCEIDRSKSLFSMENDRFEFRPIPEQAMIQIDGEQIEKGRIECRPPGEGGVVLISESGPSAWAYRVPKEALNKKPSQTIQVGYVFDDDGDGEICSQALYQCEYQAD